MTEIEKVIGGLKKEIGRQSYFKKEATSVGNETLNALVESWRVMKKHKINITKMIWDWVASLPASSKLYKKMDSSKLGIKTTIGIYKNKQGVESECHYTANNHYYGSVKKLGKEPVSYEGNFKITPELFEIDFKELMELPKWNGVYLIDRMFVPKKKPIKVVENYDSDVEEIVENFEDE